MGKFNSGKKTLSDFEKVFLTKKKAFQNAERLAENKHLPEAVKIAEEILSQSALLPPTPPFLRGARGDLPLSQSSSTPDKGASKSLKAANQDLLEKVKQQLQMWHQNIAEAKKLAFDALALKKSDDGNPLNVQKLKDALNLYQQCLNLLHDDNWFQKAAECQQEIEKRQQFQTLLARAEELALKRYFKLALSNYAEAKALFSTKPIEKSIAHTSSVLDKEANYEAALALARQASDAEKLRQASNILESALSDFSRDDGIEFLEQLQRILKGKEQFCAGLVAEKAGEVNLAYERYREALTLLPEPTEVLVRLAMLEIKTNNWASAIELVEGMSSPEATYIRGFAYAKLGELNQAELQWQLLDDAEVKKQSDILKILASRQRLFALKEIETLVDEEKFEEALRASETFIKSGRSSLAPLGDPPPAPLKKGGAISGGRSPLAPLGDPPPAPLKKGGAISEGRAQFGDDALVQTNIEKHIKPRLYAAAWQNQEWDNVAAVADEIWIERLDINSLHNWAVASYYRARINPSTWVEALAAMSTALANINIDPTLKDIPWLEGNEIDLGEVAAKLHKLLEEEILAVKDKDMLEYLRLRDRYRLEIAAFRLAGNPPTCGMRVQDLFLTPGCYSRNSARLPATTFPAQLWGTLYTDWGLAVAACLNGDTARAIQIKPTSSAATDAERFAEVLVSYHSGCYYLQQQRWRDAVNPLQQAQAKIKADNAWYEEVDRLCGVQRQAINSNIDDLNEHLDFSKFWYELLKSQAAKSYFVESKAEQIRSKWVNEQIPDNIAIREVNKLRNIDSENPAVLDLSNSLEVYEELEEISRLFYRGEYPKMVKKALKSHNEEVRYNAAEMLIELSANMQDGETYNFDKIKQLMEWAYQLYPDSSELQEIFQRTRIMRLGGIRG